MDLHQVFIRLTAEQIRELAAKGISPARVSDWRAGRRLPTLPQAKVLCIVTGESFATMVDELADAEATPEQRNFFRAVAASMCAIVSGLLLFTLPSESQAMARVSEKSAVIDHAAATGPRSIDRHSYMDACNHGTKVPADSISGTNANRWVHVSPQPISVQRQ